MVFEAGQECALKKKFTNAFLVLGCFHTKLFLTSGICGEKCFSMINSFFMYGASEYFGFYTFFFMRNYYRRNLLLLCHNFFFFTRWKMKKKKILYKINYKHSNTDGFDSHGACSHMFDKFTWTNDDILKWNESKKSYTEWGGSINICPSETKISACINQSLIQVISAMWRTKWNWAIFFF